MFLAFGSRGPSLRIRGSMGLINFKIYKLIPDCSLRNCIKKKLLNSNFRKSRPFRTIRPYRPPSSKKRITIDIETFSPVFYLDFVDIDPLYLKIWFILHISSRSLEKFSRYTRIHCTLAIQLTY